MIDYDAHSWWRHFFDISSNVTVPCCGRK